MDIEEEELELLKLKIFIESFVDANWKYLNFETEVHDTQIIEQGNEEDENETYEDLFYKDIVYI